MTTNQLSRFGFLINEFNIKERELADSLHVHYTLISKWKNKKRFLTPSSPYLAKIVEYFITLDSPGNHQKLKDILLKVYPQAKLESTSEISLLLSKWLSDKRSDSVNNRYLSKTDFKTKVIKSEFYIFKGNDGRRDAIKAFQDLSNSSPEGKEFLLFSQEDNEWFYKEKEFLSSWKNFNQNFLKEKGKIKIVHTLDRSYTSNAFSLLCWLPLHVHPNTSAYLYPKFLEDIATRFTLFVLKDIEAIFGITSKFTTKNLFTYLFLDKITVTKCQLAIQSIIDFCLPMFNKITTADNHKVLELVGKAGEQEEDNYFFTLPPSFCLLSKKLFLKILDENEFEDEDKEKYLKYQSAVKNKFRNNRSNFYRFIYNLNELEKIIKSKQIFLGEVSLFMGKPISATKDTFIACIKESISLIDMYPNLKIALFDGSPHVSLTGIDIWLKKNIITVFSARSSDPNSYYITNEATAVNSYFYSFNKIWNSIAPIHYEPDWVKNKLFKLITRFESYY